MAVTTNLGVFFLAAASLLLLEPAVGQRGGAGTPAPPSTGGGTAPGGNTGGRNPAPGNTNTPGTVQNQPNATNPTPNRPIYLTGRVMTDDGSALPLDITIQRLCSALPHNEGHTDSKGYFSIQLGADNMDAL